MKMTKGGFAILRDSLGRLTESQVSEINFIVDAMDKDKSISYSQGAYVLATTWWETAKTMLPISEYGKGKGRPYGTWYKNSKGQLYTFKDGSKNSVYLFDEFSHLYYGRGYVQLTWQSNYEKASKKLGHDFLSNPDDVMKKEYAIQILLTGMKEGWFTGKKLSDYIYQSKKDYVSARRIINGSDKAQKIAEISLIFERALRSL
ncbi:putative endolysin [Acinetobacter phage WCHABP12]|uniref:Putative endolysin n=1 Tax=Acinetobacter phage WCHABP12 TaxID=1965454 RepID=A0A1V0DZ63_9CAUD|nr:putative endolysin [Acinetobacter phage WCHABP12]ARB06760.1 putative endolysin [Acinetobacter phage WCHABP12]WPH63967.1 endolysin [Acinetobacter phage HZY2308]